MHAYMAGERSTARIHIHIHIHTHTHIHMYTTYTSTMHVRGRAHLEIRGVVSQDDAPVQCAQIVRVFKGAQKLGEIDGIRPQRPQVLASRALDTWVYED